MRVLVVEDDASIAEPLEAMLERAGYEACVVASGAAALAAAPADLVLLDLGLPDLDGVEVYRALRARGDVPVIVVSARGDELDRVLLLELGADDYVVKPFSPRELLARVRAVARRSAPTPEPPNANPDEITVGGLVVDRRARRVRAGGVEVELTTKEFDLLAYLAADPGRAFSREQILHDVWDPHWWGPGRTVDFHVASLRRKLGAAATITTVRGVGFRLEGPA